MAGTRTGAGLLAAALALGRMLAAHDAGAALDNQGRDFIVGFLPNVEGGTIPDQVQMHLTGDVATTVTIEYPVNTPTFVTTVAVVPGTIAIVTLPVTASTGWPDAAPANNAVRASAPAEFVAYMVNRVPFTSDAGLALPIDTLNNDYVVATYDEAFRAAMFVVVAAFDDTTVTITPSNDAQGGHPAGVPFAVTLDRGQGYLVQGAVNGTNGGLAGTIVTSDKPVALTNGNGCTQIPLTTTACDHIFEMAQPVQSWGLEALVANLPNRAGGTIYRVLASQNATTVLLDGVSQGTINAGQYLEIGPTAGDHVLGGDKPVFVVQFMTGLDSPGAVSGDPAMGNMTPVAQYVNHYTFSTVGGAQFAENFLTIIARDTDVATILLDGVPIGAGAFTAIGASGYSVARLPLTDGTHTTSSTEPHGIWVEGYNNYDSYIYPGGALFGFINPVGDDDAPLCTLDLVPGSSPPTFVGTGQDDRPSEDTDGNGVLDPGEDLNGNGQIDDDTGIFLVELLPGATNVTLLVTPFVPGAGMVSFTVDALGGPAAGTVRVTDGAGNTCEVSVNLAEYCGDGQTIPPEQCDDGNGDPHDACTNDCTPNVCGDGVVYAGVEECDDGNALPDDGCSPACERELGLIDHFQCYEIKPAAFQSVDVTVEDQFGTLTGQARFPHRLCAPADKNGEGILDPTEHLVAYTFKPPFVRVRDQVTVDQFGTLRLDVVRPDFLMVPTAKNGVPVAPPPTDHFQCYTVKRARGGPQFVKRTVTVGDQFESVTLELQKPVRLCAPASKNGEEPTAPGHPDHLLCYKARSAARFGTLKVTIDNQFGLDQVTLIHRRELCVPARKNP